MNRKRTISIIAAIGKNRVIGNNNTIPWSIPSDMRHFKETTTGHTVIMGRKTFETIGKPLSDRVNIIVTRNRNYSKTRGKKEVSRTCKESSHFREFLIANNPKQAIQLSDDKEIFVIGGEEIFRLMLPFADKLILTFINKEFEGDKIFPGFNEEEWEKVSSRVLENSKENDEVGVEVITFLRKDDSNFLEK